MVENNSFIKDLMLEFSLSEDHFRRLVVRAPHTYKVYNIPKKSGGARTIAQPAKETKYLQAWLLKNKLCKLPVSKCASAYRVGSSIKKNALAHVRNEYILKMDFANFFNSISRSQVERHLIHELLLSVPEAEIVSKLVCVKYKNSQSECLSVGAPSSPLISNSIMYEFDLLIDKWCSDNEVTYTRYADDLVFSTNVKGLTNIVEGTAREILASCKNISLKFNDRKTTHLSKRHHRSITGLTISNESKVTLGRNRKRDISKCIFLYSKNLLAQNEIDSLQGILGFAMHIEPLFVMKMGRKYGDALLSEIFKHRKNRK